MVDSIQGLGFQVETHTWEEGEDFIGTLNSLGIGVPVDSRDPEDLDRAQTIIGEVLSHHIEIYLLHYHEISMGMVSERPVSAIVLTPDSLQNIAPQQLIDTIRLLAVKN